jgi:uncharacterized protein (TIGR03437 family)
MRSQRIAITIVLTFFFCMPVYLISNEDGPLPRHTGGPFPGEQTCAITDCHIGIPVNSGGGRVTMTINGVPPEQYSYVPGETVPVVVRVEDAAQMRWGFELSARLADGCSQAGSFATSPNESQGAVFVYTTNSMDNIPECPAAPLQFPIHMVPKAGPGGASYEFNWTAPATSAGPVTFAAAGNAANGNREPTGDHIYTTSAVVQPAAVEPAPKPSISSGGVVLSTQTPVVPSASPNAIVSLYGQDLAPAGTAILNPEIDSDGHIATRLANTCVQINGERAPLFAVFPGQINLQWPTSPSPGPLAEVVVIRACDTPQENRSDAEMANAAAVSPAFFNFVNNADGVNPIAAIHQNNIDFVGPNSLPFAATPAAPGEFISLYATGLGPTADGLEAGEIPGAVSQITGAVSVRIGDTTRTWPDGDIFYVGISPPYAGLYVIIVKVPDTAPDGNLPVVVTVDGISSPQGPFIAVARP